MTLHVNGKLNYFECESCTETTEEHEDFQELLNEAKENGWKIVPGENGWLHICRGCSGESNLERQKRLFR